MQLLMGPGPHDSFLVFLKSSLAYVMASPTNS
jgi:hypothetical protein